MTDSRPTATLKIKYGHFGWGAWRGTQYAIPFDPSVTTVAALIELVKLAVPARGRDQIAHYFFDLDAEELPLLVTDTELMTAITAGKEFEIWDGMRD